MKKAFIVFILFAAICAAVWFHINRSQSTESLDFGNPENKFRNTEQKSLSPYAMFGDSSIVLLTEQERRNKQFVEIINSDKKAKIYKIEFDQKHGQVRLFDRGGSLRADALKQQTNECVVLTLRF